MEHQLTKMILLKIAIEGLVDEAKSLAADIQVNNVPKSTKGEVMQFLCEESAKMLQAAAKHLSETF